jgi:hypothetical protein
MTDQHLGTSKAPSLPAERLTLCTVCVPELPKGTDLKLGSRGGHCPLPPCFMLLASLLFWEHSPNNNLEQESLSRALLLGAKAFPGMNNLCLYFYSYNYFDSYLLFLGLSKPEFAQTWAIVSIACPRSSGVLVNIYWDPWGKVTWMWTFGQCQLAPFLGTRLWLAEISHLVSQGWFLLSRKWFTMAEQL